MIPTFVSTNMRLAKLGRVAVPENLRPGAYLLRLARKRTACRVHSGPFTGMRYGSTSIGSCYLPKLLGIYERELAFAVEKACALGPELIVDIGAAEGYYAVGLAMRNPASKVIAFETEESGRSLLAFMAYLNAVSSRIDIRGTCEPADLAAVLTPATHPLIVCDVEGYEEQLLDPTAVPLQCAAIIVELHELSRPGITALLRERFERTHDITLVHGQARHRDEFPWHTTVTTLLPKSYLDWTVDEWRPVPNDWLWMVPHPV